MSDDSVHIAHCCGRHGCKYGDDIDGRCPVALGIAEQDGPCEDCVSVAEALLNLAGALDELLWSDKLARRMI